MRGCPGITWRWVGHGFWLRHSTGSSRCSARSKAITRDGASTRSASLDEVGAFEHPADRVGFLAAQLFRAVRVVVDTGLHLGLRVPAGEPVHGGEAIDESVASDLLMQRGLLETREAARSEVLRYLGAPGQALAYKVGERAWLQARVAVRAAAPGLSDRAFHTAALALGPVPLHLLSDQAVAAVTEAEPHGSG